MRRVWQLGVVLVFLIIPSLATVSAQELDINGYFDDDDGSVHEQDINSIAAAGITLGCNPPSNTLFCPAQDVTRGEMAAFIRRAKNLPFVTTDYFTDDNGSVFEDDINAIAADGITSGCGSGHYCPSTPMKRTEMAAMLVRALDLPGSTTNHFVDDEGSVFENAINALADAGITLGCNPPTNNRYCPDVDVSRAQMASFLTRAFDLPHVDIEVPIELALPFSGDCDEQQASCEATLVVPVIDAYLIDEGWFYEPPYAPGDKAIFESNRTSFTVRLNGASVALTGTAPLSEGGMWVKHYRGQIARLGPGTYTVAGEWRWDGELLYSSVITLIVE